MFNLYKRKIPEVFCKQALQTLKKFNFSKSISPNAILTAEESVLLLKNPKVKFFDIRDPKNYEESHVPGSRNLNSVFSYLATSDDIGKKDLQLTFEELFQDSGLNKDDHAILYEDALNNRFGASCRGWYLLNLFGHSNVSIMHGGWKKWVQLGYPVTKELPKEGHGNFECHWNKDFWANKEDVFNVVSKKDTTTKLVDVRDNVEWVGDSSSPYGIDFTPRKGRIPGAIHVLWSDLMKTENGITHLKDNAEIKKILNDKGIQEKDNIIIYCFKGARASNSFICFKKAGFENVRNYFASWNEWSRDMKMPIDDKKLKLH